MIINFTPRVRSLWLFSSWKSGGSTRIAWNGDRREFKEAWRGTFALLRSHGCNLTSALFLSFYFQESFIVRLTENHWKRRKGHHDHTTDE